MPFGAAQSPAIFCDMTSASARIFNAQFEQRGIKASCTVYVDDYFIVADDHSHMRMAFNVMDEVGAELGSITESLGILKRIEAGMCH